MHISIFSLLSNHSMVLKFKLVLHGLHSTNWALIFSSWDSSSWKDNVLDTETPQIISVSPSVYPPERNQNLCYNFQIKIGHIFGPRTPKGPIKEVIWNVWVILLISSFWKWSWEWLWSLMILFLEVPLMLGLLWKILRHAEKSTGGEIRRTN